MTSFWAIFGALFRALLSTYWAVCPIPYSTHVQDTQYCQKGFWASKYLSKRGQKVDPLLGALYWVQISTGQ